MKPECECCQATSGGAFHKQLGEKRREEEEEESEEEEEEESDEEEEEERRRRRRRRRRGVRAENRPMGKPGDVCRTSALTHTQTNEDRATETEWARCEALVYVDIYTEIQWAEGEEARRQRQTHKDRWRLRAGTPPGLVHSEFHNTFTEGQRCAAAEQRGEQGADDTSFVWESSTPSSLLDKDNWQSHFAVFDSKAATLDSQCVSCLFRQDDLLDSTFGAYISRIFI
ncbi:unnamed protein product [Pleuronectes platessa]|uniref:Uncharacterized protein n=1 Tax=Pleuronectes platessa TaxID=8262 RepID=A0A9N7W3K5_PLEPL|nr:unnamed protein product [Pleuronectes platessa]